MKKFIVLLILAIMAVWTPVIAAPFLTCDCSVATDNITGAKLQFGTAIWIDVPVVSTCGSSAPVVCSGTSKTICYDLAALPSGPFTVKGRFKNSWGESPDSLPFYDTKGLPGIFTSTRIVQ